MTPNACQRCTARAAELLVTTRGCAYWLCRVCGCVWSEELSDKRAALESPGRRRTDRPLGFDTERTVDGLVNLR